MRRVIGFAMFFIAFGMIVSLILPNNFTEVIIAMAFLLLGYNLFCY